MVNDILAVLIAIAKFQVSISIFLEHTLMCEWRVPLRVADTHTPMTVVPNLFLVATLFRFAKNVGDSQIFSVNKRNKALHKMCLEKNIGQECERNTTDMT